ncbi:MAG: hypothetical protein IPI24_04765 [Ignavibacteria bacterium]|nr:hypothetical protein [Ignavibacteria bacterium]
MTNSPSPDELISQFKSQPIGFTEMELVKIVETLQEPSRSRGVVFGIVLGSLMVLAVSAFLMLTSTSPSDGVLSPVSQLAASEGRVASSPRSQANINPTAPVTAPESVATEPIRPLFGQCVLLTPQEIADLGITVTDSSIIRDNGVNTNEYLRGYSLHRIGQTARGSITQTQIEPVAIISEDGNLLQYQLPPVEQAQVPIQLDSHARQIVVFEIDWDNPRRAELLRQSSDSQDGLDSTLVVRYLFLTKEQTDSSRAASKSRSLLARRSIIDSIKAKSLIPVKIRLARTNSSVRTPDITFWYKPTEEFLQKLPPGFGSAIRSELRGSGSSCTYTMLCNEQNNTLQLINVHFDPNSEHVSVEFNSTDDQHVAFDLFNTIGVLVGSIRVEATKGLNRVQVPIARGNYGLVFISGRSSSGEQVASRIFIGPR